MRPFLPFGVKRRIKVESASLFLKAVERQAWTISLPGMVCSIRPDRAPPKALNFEPLLAPIATFPPVSAACALGLRYIEYSSFEEAGSVHDCFTILGTPVSLLLLARRERVVDELDEGPGLSELAPHAASFSSSQALSGRGSPARTCAVSLRSGSIFSVSRISISWRVCWVGCHVVRSSTTCIEWRPK